MLSVEVTGALRIALLATGYLAIPLRTLETCYGFMWCFISLPPF